MALSGAVRASLSDEALAIIATAGIETDADMACFWTSEEEILGLYQGEIAGPLVRAWRLANQCFARENALQPLNVPLKKSDPVPVAARPKKRCMPPAVLQSKACRVKGPQPVMVAQPQHIESKRSQHVQLMLDVVLASGSANLKFSPVELKVRAEVLPLFMRLLEKVSDSKLAALVSTLKRWIRFAECHLPADVVYWMPSAMTLSAFLQQVAQGGPTASVNVYHNMRWWVEHMGLPLPVQDPLVAMFKQPPTGYAAKQRTPIALGVFFHLCGMLQSTTGTVKAFIAWALLLCTACLRFAHLQRSVNLRCENSLLSALCKKGKRKQQGVQQPFVWCVPACPAPSVCIAPILLLEYGELCVAKSDVDFIIPDLQLPRSGRLEPGTPKLLRRMSRAKFCELMRSLLRAIGVQDEDVDQLSSYSFRRFMPTLADCQDASYEARLAVGNWVEAATDKVTATKAGSAMPIRYSDEKAVTAGMTKLRMLVSLDISRQRCSAGDLTWAEVSRLRPSASKVEKALQSAAWRAGDDMVPKHASESEDLEDEDDDSSSSSSESSSSDSEVSAEATPVVSWFVQHGRGSVHLTQRQVQGRLVPWCRDIPFDVAHSERGYGIDIGAERSLCKKCVARAPPAIIARFT
ncbi:unnamed protein product [Symbiodinium sp. CCMP2592]|nr:unnamed protein product [Symbiodinium sp. CCMP2592]CAE7810682.1 unnamed protein product [Symbiodinium sp. CCMP2592]